MADMSESEAQDYLFQMQKQAVIGSWQGILNECKKLGYESIPFVLIEQMLLGLRTTSREGFDYVRDQHRPEDST